MWEHLLGGGIRTEQGPKKPLPQRKIQGEGGQLPDVQGQWCFVSQDAGGLCPAWLTGWAWIEREVRGPLGGHLSEGVRG